MTSYLAIGATAETGATPCHSLDDWERLIAAWEVGDSEALIRIATSATPKLVPVAQLRDVTPPSMADAASAFWTKRGKPPKARATDRNGVPVVLEVPR